MKGSVLLLWPGQKKKNKTRRKQQMQSWHTFKGPKNLLLLRQLLTISYRIRKRTKSTVVGTHLAVSHERFLYLEEVGRARMSKGCNRYTHNQLCTCILASFSSPFLVFQPINALLWFTLTKFTWVNFWPVAGIVCAAQHQRTRRKKWATSWWMKRSNDMPMLPSICQMDNSFSWQDMFTAKQNELSSV